LAGRVYAGRQEIRTMFGKPDPPPWTAAGELLKQPRFAHHGANPVIDVQGDTATAETDFVALEREATGRARISLVARYRDRLRRNGDGAWVITNRTGVSIAVPGEVGTDAEWARAFARMSERDRAAFRQD
jgi:SnoaL-like domain